MSTEMPTNTIAGTYAMTTAATGKIFVRAGRPRPSVARMLSMLTLRIAPATPERGPS